MTPVVHMTMNAPDFNKVLANVAQYTERTYPQFLNGQGLRLASFAARETQKAEANKIAWQLGQETVRHYTLKDPTKRLRRARRTFSSAKSLSLYRIVNWRRKRTGRKPLGGQAMSAPARKLRAAALRSTGFIAAGWLYSIRGLSRAVGYAPSDYKLPKISGSPKGWVNPARFAINSKVTCEMANTSLLAESADRTGRRTGGPMRIAVRGLARARDLTAKDMLQHLADKLAPTFNRFSAR